MIQGLQIEFTTEQLREHIDKKVEYHTGKAEWYDAQIKSLSAGGLGANHGASNDPVTSLVGSRDRHAGKAQFFSVMGDHLVPNEVYRLTEGDLARLEIVADRYF